MSVPLQLQACWHDGIDAIAAAEWNALAPDYPFLRHEFLHALESTGCASTATGWTPSHLTLHRDGRLCAAAPMYLKAHSFGEFVFDFAWARAWEQAGVNYYPKLLCAVPFTPATGPRLLAVADLPEDALRCALLRAMEARARELQFSSAHLLFIDAAAAAAAGKQDWLLRSDCHFQWRNQGYRDFEHYLEHFAADKRKKVRRERRRVAEQGIRMQWAVAAELGAAELARVHALHAANFARHGHLPYLNLACFRRLASELGEAMVLVLAYHGALLAAAAVYFRSATTLYGRYWGADADYHSLHFEACYYQGIEYCIEQGLTRFEPGTQGEHKLSRGFEPTLTWSAHWVADARLRPALATHLKREHHAIDGYASDARAHLPFKQSPSALT